MPTVPTPPLTYLSDVNNVAYLIAVNNAAIPTSTSGIPVPAGVAVLPGVLLTDLVTSQTWRLIVWPSPANPGGPAGQFHWDLVATQPAPKQLLVSAPNGVVYAYQISAGILQTALPLLSSYNCTVPLSVLANNVQDRLEEPRGPGIFWNQSFEILTALVEAMNDLMLMVGRPTQTVDMNFSLTPNSPWQFMPKGLLLITDIRGATEFLHKVTLFDLDYSQASWGSDWESDSSPTGPVRWAPVGLGMFAVHPAPQATQNVLLSGIAYPVAETGYPYTGAEIIPFHKEFEVALEEYAAHYCRLKEAGPDFSESMALYKNYLALAERMSIIESRRDALIFSRSFGALGGAQQLVKR